MATFQRIAVLFFGAIMLGVVVIKAPKDRNGSTGIEQTGYAAESFGQAGSTLAKGIYGG